MKRLFTTLLVLLLTATALQASTAGKVRAGNRHYKHGKYEKALDAYRQAEIASPASPTVHFNLGNALHKTQGFDQAAVEFQKALTSKDPLIRSKAYYNLGNNAYRQEKTDEAVGYYKRALDLNPADTDAKYNIEFIRARKAMQNKDQQNKDGKGKKDNKQEQDSGKNNKADKKDDKGQNSESKQGMSKEDAQRILQYYNDADKNAAQKRKMQVPQMPKVEEDW